MSNALGYFASGLLGGVGQAGEEIVKRRYEQEAQATEILKQMSLNELRHRYNTIESDHENTLAMKRIKEQDKLNKSGRSYTSTYEGDDGFTYEQDYDGRSKKMGAPRKISKAKLNKNDPDLIKRNGILDQIKTKDGYINDMYKELGSAVDDKTRQTIGLRIKQLQAERNFLLDSLDGNKDQAKETDPMKLAVDGMTGKSDKDLATDITASNFGDANDKKLIDYTKENNKALYDRLEKLVKKFNPNKYESLFGKASDSSGTVEPSDEDKKAAAKLKEAEDAKAAVLSAQKSGHITPDIEGSERGLLTGLLTDKERNIANLKKRIEAATGAKKRTLEKLLVKMQKEN